MKKQYLDILFIISIAFAIIFTMYFMTLNSIEQNSQKTVAEVAEMVKPYEMLLTPAPSATPTPTVTPTPLPTLSPTPTPICLMSNQEYYNECVARGLITPANDYDDRITKERGGYMGPSGRETYYNLNMSLCVAYMRDLGYDEIEYPYWIRDDGAKMLGNYVMCAANWSIRPKGTILETSLGDAIVVDTGDFVLDYPYGVDLAVDW
jgi:hypothetical protein